MCKKLCITIYRYLVYQFLENFYQTFFWRLSGVDLVGGGWQDLESWELGSWSEKVGHWQEACQTHYSSSYPEPAKLCLEFRTWQLIIQQGGDGKTKVATKKDLQKNVQNDKKNPEGAQSWHVEYATQCVHWLLLNFPKVQNHEIFSRT